MSESASDVVQRCARAMFEAYNEEAGGRTYDGKPIPPWPAVGVVVRRRWAAAFLGLLREIQRSQPDIAAEVLAKADPQVILAKVT